MRILSDERIIEFFSKSPVKSFAAILDTLRYLDGNSISQDLEYELFDDALGDDESQKQQVRVPAMHGVSANALLALTQHAVAFDLIRRRTRNMRNAGLEPEEIMVFYEVTPSGKYAMQLLEAIDGIANSNP